jgi:hypothetical protein
VEHRIAEARGAVAPISTRDAAPCQRVTTLIGAILVAATLDATAAVARAQLAARSVLTLIVLVAFVADPTSLVAAVKVGRTIQPVATLAQTTIGEKIARKVSVAVLLLQARDTAMSVRIAPAEPRRLTVTVLTALVAFAFDAIEAGRAAWMQAARVVGARACHTSRPALGDAARCTGAAGAD